MRYLGASSMRAWQFAKMQHVAVRGGWTTFSAMQDQYNVLKREEERDMIPMCLDQGVGLTPYSPLAKGRAARPWGEQTTRSSSDNVARTFDRDVDKPVVDAVQKVAEARGVPMAQVALAWLLSKPAVSCPIVGATKPNHLQAVLRARVTDLGSDCIDEFGGSVSDYLRRHEQAHAPTGTQVLHFKIFVAGGGGRALIGLTTVSGDEPPPRTWPVPMTVTSGRRAVVAPQQVAQSRW